MAYLLANINDSTQLLEVSQALANPSYPLFYTIGDETIAVVSHADTQEWQVERGVGDSQAAAHGKGAALLSASSPYGGGGSLTVDNTVDPPEEVTTLVAPGAVVGGGEADLSSIVTVLSNTVALTDAQIKALPTTEITLAAAPGAGKTILVLNALLRIDTSENGYENDDPTAGVYVTFAGEGVDSAQSALENSLDGLDTVHDLFSSFTNSVAWLPPLGNITVRDVSPDVGDIYMGIVDISGIENKALVLAVVNGALGNFTEGDPANTGSVTVLYTIVDL